MSSLLTLNYHLPPSFFMHSLSVYPQLHQSDRRPVRFLSFGFCLYSFLNMSLFALLYLREVFTDLYLFFFFCMHFLNEQIKWDILVCSTIKAHIFLHQNNLLNYIAYFPVIMALYLDMFDLQTINHKLDCSFLF